MKSHDLSGTATVAHKVFDTWSARETKPKGESNHDQHLLDSVPDLRGRVLHVTIHQVQQSVPTEVVCEVFSAYGEVAEMFQSPNMHSHFQAPSLFIEYEHGTMAATALHDLHGVCLYPNDCQLDIRHATLKELHTFYGYSAPRFSESEEQFELLQQIQRDLKGLKKIVTCLAPTPPSRLIPSVDVCSASACVSEGMDDQQAEPKCKQHEQNLRQVSAQLQFELESLHIPANISLEVQSAAKEQLLESSSAPLVAQSLATSILPEVNAQSEDQMENLLTDVAFHLRQPEPPLVHGSNWKQETPSQMQLPPMLALVPGSRNVQESSANNFDVCGHIKNTPLRLPWDPGTQCCRMTEDSIHLAAPGLQPRDELVCSLSTSAMPLSMDVLAEPHSGLSDIAIIHVPQVLDVTPVTTSNKDSSNGFNDLPRKDTPPEWEDHTLFSNKDEVQQHLQQSGQHDNELSFTLAFEKLRAISFQQINSHWYTNGERTEGIAEYRCKDNIEPNNYKQPGYIHVANKDEIFLPLKLLVPFSKSRELVNVVDGLAPKTTDSHSSIEQIKKLYEFFCKSDSTMLEINPLAETTDKKLVTADAKLNLDDNDAVGGLNEIQYSSCTDHYADKNSEPNWQQWGVLEQCMRLQRHPAKIQSYTFMGRTLTDLKVMRPWDPGLRLFGIYNKLNTYKHGFLVRLPTAGGVVCLQGHSVHELFCCCFVVATILTWMAKLMELQAWLSGVQSVMVALVQLQPQSSGELSVLILNLARCARYTAWIWCHRVFVALLCKNSQRWLPNFFCNAKLLSEVDRLRKEKIGFIHQYTEAFVQLVASLVLGILATLSSDIQQVRGGKRHGPITALPGRTHRKSTLQFFPVILHLLGSVSFSHRVGPSHVLLQLAVVLKILETPFQARDNFQMTLLRVLEAATEEPSVISMEHKIQRSLFLGMILPDRKITNSGDASLTLEKLKVVRKSIVLSLISAFYISTVRTSAYQKQQHVFEANFAQFVMGKCDTWDPGITTYRTLQPDSDTRLMNFTCQWTKFTNRVVGLQYKIFSCWIMELWIISFKPP